MTTDKAKHQNMDKSQVLHPATYMELSKIALDDDKFRCRVEDDEERIEKLAELLTEYKKAKKNNERTDYPFPPIVVWKNEKAHTLIAGYHRFNAAQRAKLDKILVIVFEGTEDQAVVFAMKDNSNHGLRLNSKDLKFCIKRALKRFPDKTAGAVAKELGCSRSWAYEIEQQLSGTGQLKRPDKKQGADGRVRKTAKEVSSAPKTAPKKSDKQNDEVSQTTPEQVRNAWKYTPSQKLVEQAKGFFTYLEDYVVKEFPEAKDRLYIFDEMTEWAGEKRDALSTS